MGRLHLGMPEILAGEEQVSTADTIEEMSPDAIAQLLLEVLLGATVLLVARLLWVREHSRYPLYVLSVGLSIVFSVPALIPRLSAMSLASTDMVSFAMDLLLTPFVAMELFRPVSDSGQRPVRHIAPAIGSLLGGAAVAAFLTTDLDTESFKDSFTGLLLMDTIMSVAVIGYLMRKFRAGTPPGDSNTMWIRRFFFLLTVMDVLALTVEVVTGSQTMRIIYLTAMIIATLGCLAVLRKPKQDHESAPAA